MELKTTGLTSNSPLHYLLDAGAVYKNLTYDELAEEFINGELMGATAGGNEFSYAPSFRKIEVDGAKGNYKGGTVLDEEEVSLTVNLKELTAQNIATAIAGSTVDDTATNYTKITSKGKVELTDYTDSLAFVGRLAGTADPVVIILYNVLSLEGLTLSTQDKNEAVVPVKFTAHDDGDQKSFEIYWPKVTVTP
ncbi:hypothetical protein [Mesobacillus sp. S13]|uniref:hypothetical protein n=1 Tax=Mesobacillus sp. S13 TaxID=2880221 RepID=UPI001CF447D6|nr:hypothetical protein [Mesobacillus sp. S13]